MAYQDWGDPDNAEIVVCVHGVTRVSDDFDVLARALCDRFRVICPDVVGRGRSDWLADPQYYSLPQYVGDMKALLAYVSARRVAWVGTSMGGLIGMMLAAYGQVDKLIMNDVGPSLNADAMARIGSYIGQAARFPTFEQAEEYIRTISASFGPHSDEQWHKLAADVLRQDEEGKWTRHYDLRLAVPFKTLGHNQAEQVEAALWAAYDAVSCPTLLLRGMLSDLLTRETAAEMTKRGPRAQLVEFAGIGHAPTLVHDDQISVVRNFLLQ